MNFSGGLKFIPAMKLINQTKHTARSSLRLEASIEPSSPPGSLGKPWKAWSHRTNIFLTFSNFLADARCFAIIQIFSSLLLPFSTALVLDDDLVGISILPPSIDSSSRPATIVGVPREHGFFVWPDPRQDELTGRQHRVVGDRVYCTYDQYLVGEK
ncbi:hypothetical protein F4804DRAFT_313813 [Jackrogersella minutella]|nr:hypothetical protein F4804DRAFT_313813 [Jackrogersella minutella]